MKNEEMTVKAETVEKKGSPAKEFAEKAKELKLEGTPETAEQPAASDEQSEAAASAAQSTPASIEEVITLAKALDLAGSTSAVTSLYAVYRDSQLKQKEAERRQLSPSIPITEVQKKVTQLFADLVEQDAIVIEDLSAVFNAIAEFA